MKKSLVFAVAVVVAGVLATDSFALGGCGNGLRGRLRSHGCSSSCASSCSTAAPVAAKPAAAPATTKVEVKVQSSCVNGSCGASSIRGRFRIR
jgi:hypothetical protein